MPFERHDSLFDALADTLAESPGLRARFELLAALELRIMSWGLSPQLTASRLGIGRLRLHDLMHCRLKKFSLAALLDLTTRAALAPARANFPDRQNTTRRVMPGHDIASVLKQSLPRSSAGQTSKKNI